MQYLSNYKSLKTVPYNYSSKKIQQKCSPFEGALYIPSHRLIILSYADNRFLYTDYHALAKSGDGTPAIPHMVLTKADAEVLQKYCEDIPIPYIDKSDFVTVKVKDVPMPEDGEATRDWDTEFVLIEQQEQIKPIEALNGRQHIPDIKDLVESQTLKVLSWRRVRRLAEIVSLVGDFSKEDDTNLRATGRKLFLGRMQRMLTESISDSDVASLYANILPFCGKHGYEVTRTSGTGGMTSDQSTKDLFCVLRRHNQLLPNKTGACLILRAPRWYWIVYTRQNPKHGENKIACYRYAPPQIGGSVLLQGSIIDYFPIIGEFCYCKMIATLVYNKMNHSCLDVIKLPFATEAIRTELESIKYARQVFGIKGSYSAFCRAFLTCNSVSLVAYPVGQHNDHFNKNGESLENKILFCLPSSDGNHGRGGALVGDKYVFALLDWRYQSKTCRRFYVTHANDMGIGPVQPTGSQQRLENFFRSGGTEGRTWSSIFNNQHGNRLVYRNGSIQPR